MKKHRDEILSLLGWPSFSFSWPPHEYPWSKRDEQRVLTWLSTKFTSSAELETFLCKEKPLLRNKNHSFIHWLHPTAIKIHKTDNHSGSTNTISSLLFIYNCLEKALLWYNPEPSWPSSLHSSIYVSRQLLKEHLCGESSIKDLDKASRFLGRDGWGDFGWLKHHPEYGDFIHLFYEVLECSQSISNRNNLIENLLERSKEALIFAITQFWENEITSNSYKFDYLYYKELNRIISHEEAWCNKILKQGASLNWDCITEG